LVEYCALGTPQGKVSGYDFALLTIGEKMSETLMEKIDRIENLLREIKAKIDNFLGFEALDNEERNELQGLQEAISSGEYLYFAEVFKG
jgi:flavodoxin